MAGQEFWSDPNTPKPAPKPDLESSKPPVVNTEAPGGFWQGASEQAITKKEEARKPAAPKPPRKILKKAIIITAGALLGLILLALVFAPSVASVYARNTVIDFEGPKGGRLMVQGADLSWSGPQSIGPVVLLDDQNAEIAKVTVKADTSILSVVFGSRDMGTITVTGNARVIKEKDGQLNVATATAGKDSGTAPATTPKSSGPMTIPEDLAAKLNIKDFRVTFEDRSEGGQSVEIRDLNVSGAVRTGQPITLDLSADVFGADKLPGRIDVKAALSGWSDSRGNVADFATPAGLNALDIDSDIALRELPMRLIDGIAKQNGKLLGAVGERLTVTLKAKGSLKDATATLQTSAQNIIAKGQITARDGTVRVSQPIELGVRGGALAAFVQQDKAAPARVSEFPDITISVPALQLKIPAQGPLDLRGTMLQASINTTRAAGDVEIAAQRKAFEVKPLSLALDVQDLANGVTIKGGTSATIGGAPAGNLSVDIAANGVLDDKGAPVAGMPKSLKADIALAGVQTAIAQAFVQSTGIDLAKDIGPTLDARVTADALAGAAGSLPDGRVEFSISIQHVKGGGAIAMSAQGIKSETPVTFTVDSASSIASKFVKNAGGWGVSPQGGTLSITIDGVDVAMASVKDANGATTLTPNVPGAKARLVASLARWTLNTPAGSPLDLGNLAIASTLTGNGAAQTEINGAMTHEGSPVAIKGSINIADLLGPMNQPGGAVQMNKMKPQGSFTVKGVPASLIGAAAPASPAKPGEKPMNLAALVKSALGPTIDLTLNAAGATPVNGKPAYTVDGQVSGARVAVAVGAMVAPEARADLRESTITLTLEPESAAEIVKALGQDASKLPRLAQRSTVRVVAQPVSIPLTAIGPDFDKAGSLAADITIPGALLVSGLTMPNGTDSTGRPLVRDMGQVGLQDFKVALRAPGASLGQTGGEAVVTVTTQVLDGPRSGIANLNASVKMPLKNGAPSGDGVAVARIKDVVTAGIDRILNQPGMVSGALGDKLEIEATYPIVAAAPTAPAKASVPASGSGGRTGSSRLDDEPTVTKPAAGGGQEVAQSPAQGVAAEVTISSPRLRMSRSLHASVSPTAIRVLEPVTITWNADPTWLSRFTAGANGDGPHMTKQLDVRMSINELALGQPGPLTPGVFAADIGVTVPSVEMVDKKGQRIAMQNIKVKANRELAGSLAQTDPTALGIEVGVASAAVGDAPPTKDILVKALAARLATPTGDFDKNRAQFSVNAQIPALPTAMVDMLANQDGMLEEALGSVIECNVKADKFSLAGKEPGSVEASMKSPRAQASLKGNIVNGGFTSTQPLQVSVNEITKALSDRFVKGMPFVGELSKSTNQAPASVVGPSLMVPLDNDMSKLNGDVTIDPGELLFKPSKDFAGLLKQLNQNADGGLLGQRLQPLALNIKDGVVSYQKWTLPLGQFNVVTEGVVDLVAKRIDVITYLPFGALNEKGAKMFQSASALGGVIDAGTLMPFRTRGPLSGPTTAPDLELFGKQLLNNKNLEKTIQKGLEQLLKKPDPAPPATPK